MNGDKKDAAHFAQVAKTDAQHWMQAANDGDHYRLAFDKPGTWSQVYNLVWDKILGLNVFPDSVSNEEIAWYKSHLDPYGLRLISTRTVTKTDWTVWTATLAHNQADFETLITPAYNYLDQTQTRDPISDSYDVDNVNSGGMHARPVVGGLFVKLLDNKAMWNKWAAGDLVKAADWAPLPEKPNVTYVIPNSTDQAQTWRYTTTANPPQGDWTAPDFDDSAWKTGEAPFGNNPPAGVANNTSWRDTPGDIWIRRKVTLPHFDAKNLVFMVYHDEDVTIYVNGVKAASDGGFNSEYDPLDISPAALALLKPGATVTIAATCHQTTGGQGIDIGLASSK
jgi:hypothetical protein